MICGCFYYGAQQRGKSAAPIQPRAAMLLQRRFNTILSYNFSIVQKIFYCDSFCLCCGSGSREHGRKNDLRVVARQPGDQPKKIALRLFFIP